MDRERQRDRETGLQNHRFDKLLEFATQLLNHFYKLEHITRVHTRHTQTKQTKSTDIPNI